jgi:hypothetical protein
MSKPLVTWLLHDNRGMINVAVEQWDHGVGAVAYYTDKHGLATGVVDHLASCGSYNEAYEAAHAYVSRHYGR